jgi:glycyl-tRNA synthetase beta chain
MDFLLEIGTEELPARFVGPAVAQLEQLGTEMLRSERIGYARLAAYATPRRLALYVWEIGEQQADLVEEIKGPSRKAAFDENGQPTRAAEGFARSQGVAVADLVVQTTAGGEYVYARKRLAGRRTRQVLPELAPRLINSLSFPRPMRWGDRDLKFARPIRWLLCLLGKEVVDFEFDLLRPGRITYGIRIFSEEPVSLDEPGEYFQKLEQSYVMVDQEQRRRLIWSQAQDAAAAAGGKLLPNEELLEEVTNLVEYPTPVCGGFDRRFLELPAEVVITPMQDHQRYFPVWSQDGRLLPRFVAFANGPVANRDLVRAGNEKVLRARLCDAEFFYNEDLKTPLAEKVEKLHQIVFLEGLGTIHDKMERIVRLTRYLCSQLKFTAGQRRDAERAALLAKADLVTSMVYEFPELQGIMGAAYAAHDGEKRDVCQAIREHYQPRYAGDEPPGSRVGAVVALADKIDNLVGCFAMGLEPSGSQDPYALRRQALGVCHTVLRHGFDLSLDALIDQAYQGCSRCRLQVACEETRQRLGEFFRARLRNLFLDQGYSWDLVEAALGGGSDRIAAVSTRLKALSALRATPEFEAFLTAFTRAANLARQAGAAGSDGGRPSDGWAGRGGARRQVDPGLFVEDGERILYQAWARIKKEVLRLERRGEIEQALVAASKLLQPISGFFDQVLVMVDDAALRENRLALLDDIATTLRRFGDLDKIVR